ncbi:uncharacterized protein N7459_007354 [Penicillium hispanicum]|uniref:uncharacterized protein n=1 Tax=Penicillium hispanicum TaxID=1080232 RepID=UPI002540158D|nr:uncharacterized protein N7459_007354 [Penicillium hispanicum]KAJ5578390.1 hypothetical protein N7459_007354 [Penicillium hispanicum]
MVYIRLGTGYNIPLNQGVTSQAGIALCRPARQTYNDHQPTDDERFPGEEVYEVERILDKRVTPAPGRPRRDGTRRFITKYLVCWRGQTTREDQWVRAEDMIGAAEAIQEFEDR